MAESATNVKIDSDLQLLDDNKIIKKKKPSYFTCSQIRDLLNLRFLDMSPQECVL